jgi:hypothetical protein
MPTKTARSRCEMERLNAENRAEASETQSVEIEGERSRGQSAGAAKSV